MTDEPTLEPLEPELLEQLRQVNIEHEDAELGQIEGVELAARTRREAAGR